MSDLSSIAITHRFNGDGGKDKISAPSLDTQLGNLAANDNRIKAVLDHITDSSNNLAPNTVGRTQLQRDVYVNELVYITKCKAVSTIDQSLSGLPIIDGYQTVANDRVLLAGQDDSRQNGPWVVGAPWTRPTDYAANTAPPMPLACIIVSGTVYAGDTWASYTTGVIVNITRTSWRDIGIIAGGGSTGPIYASDVITIPAGTLTSADQAATNAELDAHDVANDQNAIAYAIVFGGG